MHDLIVVGAGPAGATAGLIAAKAGLDVQILEKESLPRDKTCGGGVLYRTTKILDQIGISQKELDSVCYRISKELWMINASNTTAKLQSEKPLVFMTLRKDFDYFLAQKAQELGAVVRDNHYVREITYQSDAVEVRTKTGQRFRAKAIIGADGVNGTVGKKIGLHTKWRGDGVGVAIEARAYLPQEEVDQHSMTKIYYGLVDYGYIWLFPKHDHIGVGIGQLVDYAQGMRKKFLQFIEKLGWEEYLDKPSSFRLPFGHYNLHPIADRTILCGDASGFVDPWVGEGIHFAIESGKYAGEAVINGLEKEDLSTNHFTNTYLKACRRTIYPELKNGLRFRNIIFGRYRDRAIKALADDQRLQEHAVRIIQGEGTYSDLNRFLIKWGIKRLLRIS
ncbi:MAG: geranylgeranyl reductase family protein [Candidatus Hodarchaeota archaeon]